jgi:hypothetical protein
VSGVADVAGVGYVVDGAVAGGGKVGVDVGDGGGGAVGDPVGATVGAGVGGVAWRSACW